MQEQFVKYREEMERELYDDSLSKVNKFLDERINYFVSLTKLSHKWGESIKGIIENHNWWETTSEFYDDIETLLQKERYLITNSAFINELEELFLQTNNKFKIKESSVPSKDELKKDHELDKTFKGNLLYYHINNKLLSFLLSKMEDMLSQIGKRYLECFDIMLEFNNITSNSELTLETRSEKALLLINSKLPVLEESINLLKDSFPTVVESAFEEVENYLRNTNGGKSEIDILFEKLSFKDVNKSNTRFENALIDFKKNFEGYFIAIFDITEFLEDILWFNSRLRNEYFLVLNNFFATEKYLSDNVFNKLAGLIQETTESIQASKKGNFISTISKRKSFLLKKITTEFIVDFVDHFSIDDFTSRINNFIDVVENNLSEFSKDYSFIKGEDIVFGLNPKDMAKFSPKDLLTPIVINKLKLELESVTKNINNDLIKLNTDIIAYSDMVEFNLESAESLFNDNSELFTEARGIATEGMERAKISNEDFIERFRNVGDQFENLFIDASEKALANLTDFIDIEKLLSIRIQASKDKAVQNIKDKFNDVYLVMKTFIVTDIKRFLVKYASFRKKLIAISNRVGLSSEGLELSEELSKYLLQVSSTLEKLPYIYRKIFENEPVVKEDLFLGRTVEVDKFTLSYKGWLNNIPKSLLIVGEKGSGTSSIINISLSKINPELEIFKKKLDHTIFQTDELINELKSLFNYPEVDSVDGLIEQINLSPSRMIVVIENIEDYFLKIVGGFEVVKNLLRIISETNEKVFWVTTCNVYTWKYLNVVLSMNDSFTSVIVLTELTKDNIRDIIIKRHKISGYKLKYSTSEEFTRNSSFNKKSDIEKQQILADSFFEKIKELSPNNIAISLFLWLRSIINFKDNEILINTNLQRDFSFLRLLSPQKQNTLAAMIINDGLTINEHNLIFNLDDGSTKLILMSLEDNGIIFQTKNKYKINFQLYRPIINLLKNKNILH